MERCTQAAPWGLTGYFLDPELFRLLAHSARLQLPAQPLHTPRWRQAGCLTFHMHLSHVLRVGHLQPLTAWRSLLYPSPARLPMSWGVTDLPLPMPHDLPSPDLTATARWLVRDLILAGADRAPPLHPGDGALRQGVSRQPALKLLRRFMCKGSSPGRGRTLTGEPAP